jgi:hypothetical protein
VPSDLIKSILNKQRLKRLGYDSYEQTESFRQIPDLPDVEDYKEQITRDKERYYDQVAEQLRKENAKVTETPLEDTNQYPVAESTYRPLPDIKEPTRKTEPRDYTISQAPKGLVDQEFDKRSREEKTAEAMNQLFLDDLVKKLGKEGAKQRMREYGTVDPWFSVFMSGASGADVPMTAQLMKPINEKLFHTLGFLGGAALIGSGVRKKAVEGTHKIGEALDLGSRPIHIMGRMAGSASTLVGKTVLDLHAAHISDKDISVMDMTKAILASAGYGTAFGLVGSINSPFVRIPTETAVGYLAEKIGGGTDEDAMFSAIVFTALGAMNNKNLRPIEREFAYQRLKKNFVDYTAKRYNAPKEAVENLWNKHDKTFRQQAEKHSLGDIDNVISKMKADWDIMSKKGGFIGKADWQSGMEAVRKEGGRVSAKQQRAEAQKAKDITVPETAEKVPQITPLEQVKALQNLGYKEKDIVSMSGEERKERAANELPPGSLSSFQMEEDIKPKVEETPQERSDRKLKERIDAKIEVREKLEPPKDSKKREAFYGENIGEAQRGEPEIAMVNVQVAQGGGILGGTLEPLGDIINRAYTWAGESPGSLEVAREKLDKALRELTRPYGFEREHRDNIRGNSRARGLTEKEHEAEIDKALERYKAAWENFPTYNEVQRLLKEANIAFAEKKWDKVVEKLEVVKKYMDEGEKSWNKRLNRVGEEKVEETTLEIKEKEPKTLESKEEPSDAMESGFLDLENLPIKSKGNDSIGRPIPEWRGAEVYHVTDKAGFESISTEGYRIDLDEQGGYYGKAVSFTPSIEYAKQFGDYVTKAKISKDAKILNQNDEYDWKIFTDIVGNASVVEYDQLILNAGYDGVYDAGAGDLFIYNPNVVEYIKSAEKQPDMMVQEKPTVEEPVVAPTEKEAGGLVVTQEKPTDVKIDESKFQPREEYNQQVINDIAENFDPAKWDEPILWKDPETGTKYVVSGHHRHKGVLKGGYRSANYKVLPEGTTLEQARDYSEIGNLARTEQTDFENANVVRRRLERGDSIDSIAEALPALTRAKTTQGRKQAIKGLVNLAYLDDKGSFKENYESVTEFPKIVGTAKLIGDFRKKYDWMSNTQERDIFNYLYVENGIKGDYDNFIVNLRTSLDRMDSMEEKPQRLVHILRKEALTVPENAHDEIKTSIGEIDNHIETITRQLNDPISLKQLVDARVNGGAKNEVEALKEVKKELHEAKQKAIEEKVELINQVKQGSPKQEGLFESDYRGVHRAASRDPEYNNSGDNPTDIYPEDIYGANGARYYGDSRPEDAGSISVIRSMKGKPNKKITIYRAVPSGVTKINPGDWVTISKGYAEDHGYRYVGDDYQVISKEVKASEIHTAGESIHEWGYNPNVLSKVDDKVIVKTKSTEFKKWFKDSKIVDDKGKPLVVYHGTTQDFDIFDITKTEKEADLGGGFYFTNSTSDVNRNYASIKGADLQNKIEKLAERNEDYGQDQRGDEKIIRGIEKELTVNQGVVMPVYLSLQNPIDLSSRGTYIDPPYKYDEKYDEYYDDEESVGYKIIEAIPTVSRIGWDVDWAKIQTEVSELLMDGVYAKDLIANMKNMNEIAHMEGENGELVGNQFISDVFKKAGFDGFIIPNADQRFKNMGMEEGTVHYIAFEPTQIKSTGNKGDFDPNNPNILAESEQFGLFGGTDEIMTLNKAQELQVDEARAELQQVKAEQEYLKHLKDSKMVSYSDYQKQFKDLGLRKAEAENRIKLLKTSAKMKRAASRKAVSKQQGLFDKVKAYHGSPHTFEQFSLEKIGTGEGAQAFGWGLYFTDSKGIADFYAKELAGKAWTNTFTLNGMKIISDARSIDYSIDVIAKQKKYDYPQDILDEAISKGANKYQAKAAVDILYDNPSVYRAKKMFSGSDTDKKDMQSMRQNAWKYLGKYVTDIDINAFHDRRSDLANAHQRIIEDLLIDEWNLKNAFEEDGIEGVKDRVKITIESRIEATKKQLESYPEDKKWAEGQIKVANEYIESLDEMVYEMDSPVKNLYEVEINSPEELNFINYTGKVTEEQKALILSKLDTMPLSGDLKFRNPKPSKEKWKNILHQLVDGRELYKAIKDEMAHGIIINHTAFEKRASLWLKSIGFDGFKFLADRGRRDGVYNYVIFDDKQVKVVNATTYKESVNYERLKNGIQAPFNTEADKDRAISKAVENAKKTIGNGITYRSDSKELSPSDTLDKFKRVDIKGQTIASTKDAAELLKIFRDPKIEILHSVMVGKGGKVIAHNAISSGSGYYISLGHKDMASIILRAKRLKAKEVYLTHNHPSGDPTPSTEDLDTALMFDRMAEKLYPGVKVKHIVINHNKYASIGKVKDKIGYQFKPYNAKRLHSRTRIISEQDIIREFNDGLEVVPSKNNKIGVMVLDSKQQLIAMEYINQKEYLFDLRQAIVDKKREHKGRVVMLVGNNISTERMQYVPDSVVDVVSIDGFGNHSSLRKMDKVKKFYIKADQTTTGGNLRKATVLMEKAKTPRNKALARAHILEKEIGLSGDEISLLKRAITGFESLKNADNQGIKAYVQHLVKLKTGKDPIEKPKKYKKTLTDVLNEKKQTDDKVVGRIKNYLGNVNEAVSGFNYQIVKSVDKALRSDFGEGGRELQKLLRESELDIDVWVKPQEAKLEKLYKKIPSEEKEVLKDIIESGGVKDMSDATKEFVEWWGELTNDVFVKGQKYINKDLNYIDNYFPLVLQEDFYNNMNPQHPKWGEVVDHVRNVLEERMAYGQQELYKSVSESEAQAYILEFLEGYREKGSRAHFLQQVFEPTGKYRHSYPLEMHRDRIFPEWAYNNDVGDVAHSYIDKSYTSIAYGKHLEKVDEEYNYQKVNELIDQIKNEGYDHKLASDMVAYTMGIKTLKTVKAHFASTAKTVTSFLLSLKTSVKNLGDVQKAFAWTNNYSVLTSLFKTYVMPNQAHRQMGNDLIGSRKVFTQSLQKVGVGNKLAQKWTQLILFQWSEKTVRKQTGLSSIVYARSLMKNWTPDSNTKIQKYIQRTLERLTELDLSKLKNIKNKGGFNREEELRIGNLAISAAQPTSNLDRPIGWQSSAFINSATIFRSFGHKGLRFLKDYILKEATKHGNFAPFIRFVAWRLALGYTIEEVTDWLFATTEEEEEKLAKRMYDIMAETGELGLLPDMMFAIEHSGWTSPVISLIFGAFWSSLAEFTQAGFIAIDRYKKGKDDPTRQLRREVGKRTLKKVPFVGKPAYESFVGEKKSKSRYGR